MIARASTPARTDDNEWRDEISRALAQLSAPTREAFLLKHVEGQILAHPELWSWHHRRWRKFPVAPDA